MSYKKYSLHLESLCLKTLNPFNVDFWTLINRKKKHNVKRDLYKDLKLLQIKNKYKSLHKYNRTHLDHHWSSQQVLEVKSHHYKYHLCVFERSVL